MNRPLAVPQDANGKILLCELQIREATSAPARLKVSFVTAPPARITELMSGEGGRCGKPPAGATTIAYGDEFRIECN